MRQVFTNHSRFLSFSLELAFILLFYKDMEFAKEARLLTNFKILSLKNLTFCSFNRDILQMEPMYSDCIKTDWVFRFNIRTTNRLRIVHKRKINAIHFATFFQF